VSFIILEGTDGGGKTTLARNLVEEVDGYYRHVGPPEPDIGVFAQYVRDMRDWYDPDRTVVIDRFHLGTWAYGKEFRGKDGLGDMDWLEWRLLEEMLMEYGALLVLVKPSWDAVASVWQSRQKREIAVNYPEYESDLDRLSRVRHHFDEAFEHSMLPKMTYDRENLSDGHRLREMILEVVV
jgi:thymidylate kinase